MNVVSPITTQVFRKIILFSTSTSVAFQSYFVFDQVRSVLEYIFVSYITDVYQTNVIIFEIISSFNPNMCWCLTSIYIKPNEDALNVGKLYKAKLFVWFNISYNAWIKFVHKMSDS